MASFLRGFGLQAGKKHNRPTLFDRHPGQAIVLIAFLMIVIIGFTGLALDGGELYYLQRNVQNAADAAVLAALYEICKDPTALPQAAQVDATTAATQAIKDNGFVDTDGGLVYSMTDGVEITIDPNAIPPGGIWSVATNYVTVEITANKPARLIQVMYQGPLQVTVRSAGKCVPTTAWTQGRAIMAMGSCTGNGGGQDAISYTGSGATIEGGIFSNGDIYLQNSDVTGGGSAVGSVDGNGSTYSPASNTGATPITLPDFWDIDDFKSPYGRIYRVAAANNAYFYSSGAPNNDAWSDFSPNPLVSGNPKDGIYFVAGDLKMNASQLGGKDLNGVTFVATGQIELGFGPGGAGAVVPWTIPPDDRDDAGVAVLPAVFSSYLLGSDPCPNSAYAISTTGQVSWLGVIYAPNGGCTMSFSSGESLDGAILCTKVDLAGSSFTISYNPNLIPPLPPEVGMTG